MRNTWYSTVKITDEIQIIIYRGFLLLIKGTLSKTSHISLGRKLSSRNPYGLTDSFLHKGDFISLIRLVEATEKHRFQPPVSLPQSWPTCRQMHPSCSPGTNRWPCPDLETGRALAPPLGNTYMSFPFSIQGFNRHEA